MSVLVFVENWDGKFKKSSYEAVSYANNVAKQLGTTTTALVIGNVNDDDLKGLGNYGASKVLVVKNEKILPVSSRAITSAVAEAAQKEGSKIVVFSYTYTGKSVAGRVSVRLKAGMVAGAIQPPSSVSPFTVRKKCFSGKSLTDVAVNTDVKVIAIIPNSYKVDKGDGAATLEVFAPSINENYFKVISKEVKKSSGKVPLTEAEVVVSAGRGMKGPENWGMIEKLAETIGAATACSKPVADVNWRPHHEHVGQTGITIAPNLYIAIGISGAIQHLAGVSSSKVIVVINNDKEAPFFKAADYGIVGDAFEIVPKLTEAFKKAKEAHH